MKIALTLMDRESNRVGHLLANAQQAMLGILHTVIESPDVMSRAARTRLEQNLATMRLQWSKAIAPSEGGQLRENAYLVENLGETDSKLRLTPEMIEEQMHISDAAVEAAHERLRQILQIDVDTVLAVFRTIQLKANMHSVATRTPATTSVRLVKQAVLKTLTFTRADASGKKWGSVIYAKNVARGLLVNLYVEAFLLTLLGHGIDEARIKVPGDAGYINFTVLGTSTDKHTHAEIVDEWLHPNAQALPERVPEDA